MVEWACGAGKTLLAIMWALSFPGRVLIITRARTRVQWRKEFFKFTKSVPVQILEGKTDWIPVPASQEQLDSGSKPWRVIGRNTWKDTGTRSWHDTRMEAQAAANMMQDLDLKEGARILIIGWDVLYPRLPALLAWRPDSVVADESHRAKSHRRWKRYPAPDGVNDEWELRPNASAAAMRLSRKAQRWLCLTATPTPDRTRDWWAQLDLIDPYAWNKFRVFAIRYCAGFDGKYGFESAGSSRLDELYDRLSFVRHVVTPSEARKELPPLRRSLVVLPMAELVPIKTAKREWTRARKKGPAAMMELKLAHAAGMKRDYLVDRILAAMEDGQKVVVFDGRKRNCAALNRALNKGFKRVVHEWLKSTSGCSKKKLEDLEELLKSAVEGDEVAREMLRDRGVDPDKRPMKWLCHGDNTHAEMQEVLDTYAGTVDVDTGKWTNPHPGPCVLIGTIDAWGEAYDGLQDTDLALIPMLPWTGGKITQGEGRFPRPGSDRSTEVEYIIAEGTVDEDVQDTVLSKLAPAGEKLGDEQARVLTEALGGGKSEEGTLEDFASRLLARERERQAKEGEESDPVS